MKYYFSIEHFSTTFESLGGKKKKHIIIEELCVLLGELRRFPFSLDWGKITPNNKGI